MVQRDSTASVTSVNWGGYPGVLIVSELSRPEQLIRERLRLLLRDYSLAELATRSGFPKSSVSHFLDGRTIPMAFCTALARNLGLSPSWILLGAGEAYAGMSTQRGIKIVEDLNLLLDAQNDVLRQRQHAVDSGRLAQILAESTTLRQEQAQAEVGLDLAVGDLCHRLAQISCDYVAAMQFTASHSVLEVGERLARLTNNPTIHGELARARSYLDISTNRFAESMVASQRARQYLLAARNRDISIEIGQIAEQVISTSMAGRSLTAHRVAETMLAYYRYILVPGEFSSLRLVVYGRSIGLHLGKPVGRAFRDIASAYKHLREPLKSAVFLQYMTAILDIGYMTPTEMTRAEYRKISSHRPLVRELLYFVLMRYAIPCERVADLKMIDRTFSAAQDEMQDERALLARLHGRCVIDALEGRVKRAVATMEHSPLSRRHCQADTGMQWLYAMGSRCHVLRLAGETNRAQKLLMETDRQLEDREIVDALVIRALHYRNALHLIQNKRYPLLKRAREFYRTLLANGYHGYRDAFIQSCVRQ